MATGGDVDDLIAQFKKWNSVSKPKDPNKMHAYVGMYSKDTLIDTSVCG
jgi:hypothetical protein